MNGLKNENQIESEIHISSRGKGTYLIETVEIKDLTPKLFKNANKIFFKESCNSLELVYFDLFNLKKRSKCTNWKLLRI